MLIVTGIVFGQGDVAGQPVAVKGVVDTAIALFTSMYGPVAWSKFS